MMLDMKRTFDEIVEAHADAERARAILDNPFYQSLSAGFAGTQEYMAMEKLGQLRARDEWDLIVVDTPPSRSALDFLDAPKRLGLVPGRQVHQAADGTGEGGRPGGDEVPRMSGMSMMTGTLSKLLGGQLLQRRADVRGRHGHHVRRLPHPRGRHVPAAPGARARPSWWSRRPERDALREAAYFVERLAAEDDAAGRSGAQPGARQRRRPAVSAERALAAAENLEEGGIVDRGPGKGWKHGAPSPGPQNLTAASTGSRTTPARDTDGHDSARRAEPAEESTAAAEQLTAGLLRLHAERMQLLAREQRTRDRFTALHPEVPVAEVAALPGDVHDLAGLRAIGDRLADGPTRPGPGAAPEKPTV